MAVKTVIAILAIATSDESVDAHHKQNCQIINKLIKTVNMLHGLSNVTCLI